MPRRLAAATAGGAVTVSLAKLAELELAELPPVLTWMRDAVIAGGTVEGLAFVDPIDQAIAACSRGDRGDALRSVAQLFKRLATMLEEAAFEADRRAAAGAAARGVMQ